MRDGKHVILCVDDDQDLLDVLRTILEANGYVMEEANSAEDGLKAYKDLNPDLLLVDLMMEEVDAGTNFVRELRMLDNQAPVFMLSSVGDQLSANINPTELGLSGVLQKPVNSAALLSLLRAKLK
jgi:DNA-binding response OmpR family regulator